MKLATSFLRASDANYRIALVAGLAFMGLRRWAEAAHASAWPTILGVLTIVALLLACRGSAIRYVKLRTAAHKPAGPIGNGS